QRPYPAPLDPAATIRTPTTHSPEKLASPPLGPTARAQTRIDAVDGHRTAEHRCRGRRVSRGGEVAWDANVSRAHLSRHDRDQVAVAFDLDAALPEGCDGQVDERRGHEGPRDAQPKATLKPGRDEQER